MAAIDELLKRISDPDLRRELTDAVTEVRRTKDYGLVFESHLPETVRLPQHAVRPGVKVARRDAADKAHGIVLTVVDGVASVLAVRAADGTLVDPDHAAAEEVPLEDLVVVAEFGEPIHPGLRHLGSVHRGGDKPAHVVIKGENHHALEALQFTHAGAVDCIYIDPPYNTGARDWKYDNDYVDGEDVYRHSKWLAFMERRLKLAKRLLNPENSVLIVTIDEKEYLRLGLLLEQVFPEARITMVTTSISSGGVSRSGTFGRSAEYLFFVQFGTSRPVALALGAEWNAVKTANKEDIYWSRLIRAGTNASRSDRPNQFYPVHLFDTPDGPRIHSVGLPLLEGDPNDDSPPGTVAVWPIRQDGSHGNWQVGVEALEELVSCGHARLGRWHGERTTIYYLKRGERKKVADGVYAVVGARPDGSIITDSEGYETTFVPTDIWRLTSHDAGNSGSRLLARLLPSAKFPFPKSLYAVEDALRFFAKDRPEAVVLDFFSGSGTTAHAVARLNKQDGGRRQSISVTNNEVGVDEAKALREQGLRPGDEDWEARGIFEHITRPRIEAAITGRTPEGDPVKGDYKFTDEFPMADGFEENVEFFALTYEDPSRVELDLAFKAIAPLLWLRAGAQGPIIDTDDVPFATTERYGVLFDTDHWQPFVAALADTVRTVCIVTDSPTTFAAIRAELPAHVTDAVRLYERYLTTFALNAGGTA